MNDREERRCFRPAETLRYELNDGVATVHGLAVPYEQPSEDLGGYREIIKRGAFTDSLKSEDLRADVEHDIRIKLGRSAKGTLVMTEDARGVFARIQLPNNTTGRDVAEDVRNGNLDAMSITFLREPIEASFRQEGGEVFREIHKAVLTGVTLTAFPAYRQTAGELSLRSLAAWRKEQEDEAAAEAAKEQPDTEILRKRLEIEEALN